MESADDQASLTSDLLAGWVASVGRTNQIRMRILLTNEVQNLSIKSARYYSVVEPLQILSGQVISDLCRAGLFGKGGVVHGPLPVAKPTDRIRCRVLRFRDECVCNQLLG